MKAVEIARKILEEVGISQKTLAKKIGAKSQQAVFNMFNAKQGMRIDNFIKIMNALGYDVQVKNRVTDETITVEVEKCVTDTVE